MRLVEVEAAQQEDEVSGIRLRRTKRSGFVANGFEKHGMKRIEEARRFHAGETAVAGEVEAVMRDVVGSAGGGPVAIPVIVKPGFEQSDQGRRQVKFGDAR